MSKRNTIAYIPFTIGIGSIAVLFLIGFDRLSLFWPLCFVPIILLPLSMLIADEMSPIRDFGWIQSILDSSSRKR